MSQSTVMVKHSDAVARCLPPIRSKLVGTNKCRYCVFVEETGACDRLARAIVEARVLGLSYGNGESVYRDLDTDTDPGLVPYFEIPGMSS